MKIRYLGTGSAEGLPALFCTCEGCKKAKEKGGKNIRSRSQTIINSDLLIDFPADTYLHTVNGTLELENIHSLLITHTHSDHFYLDDLFQINETQNKQSMRVYGSAIVGEKILNHSKGNLGKIEFIQLEPFIKMTIDNDYEVIPLVANHSSKEQCFIYIIKKSNQNILYAHDTGYFPQETWSYLAQVYEPFDIVSLDCNQVHLEKTATHMGIEENLLIIEQLQQRGLSHNDTAFIINHISHKTELLHEEIESLIKDKGLAIAYDGLEIDCP